MARTTLAGAAPSHEPVTDVPRLFVGQVPPERTEQDLLPLFLPYGEVKSLHIVKAADGRSKGCAMVLFARWSEAEAACEAHDGRTVLEGGKGRPLVVSFANPRRSGPGVVPESGIAAKKLFVGQVPRTVSEEELLPLFEAYGEVENLLVHRKHGNQHAGCAFVQYKRWADAEAAIEAHHSKTKLAGSTLPLVVKFADAKRKVEHGAGAGGDFSGMQGYAAGGGQLSGAKRGPDSSWYKDNKRQSTEASTSSGGGYGMAPITPPYNFGGYADPSGMAALNLGVPPAHAHAPPAYGSAPRPAPGVGPPGGAEHGPAHGGGAAKYGAAPPHGASGGSTMHGGANGGGGGSGGPVHPPSYGNGGAAGYSGGGPAYAMGLPPGYQMQAEVQGGMGPPSGAGGSAANGMPGLSALASLTPAQLAGLQQLATVISSGLSNLGVANGGVGLPGVAGVLGGGVPGGGSAGGGVMPLPSVHGHGHGMSNLQPMGRQALGGPGMGVATQGGMPPQVASGGRLGSGVSNPGARDWKLFVGQVPFEASERDLWHVFAPMGEVLELYVLKGKDGTSRGCAFVTYAHQETADAAIAQLNGHPMGSKRLVVKFANN